MTKALAKIDEEDDGPLAELRPRERAFVEHYVNNPIGHGAKAAAARAAGYGNRFGSSSPESIAAIASRLMRRPWEAATWLCCFWQAWA